MAPFEADRDEASSRLEQALLDGDRAAAAAALDAVRAQEGAPALEHVLVLVLERIGAGWEQGRLALSQVYLAGRICEDLTASLPPAAAPPRCADGAIAIAVLEDHHVLGKRMVSAILRAGGWPIRDLGHGLSSKALAAQAADGGVRVLLVSTLMLRAALQVRELVRAIRAARAPVRVVVGGAPFRIDPALWREVGADAMGSKASDAPALVARWAGEAR